MKNRRVRNLVLLLFFLSAFLCIGVLQYLNVKQFERSVVEQTQEHLLTISKTHGQMLSNVITTIQKDLYILANDPEIQNAFLAECMDRKEKFRSCPRLEATLSQYLEPAVTRLERVTCEGVISEDFSDTSISRRGTDIRSNSDIDQLIRTQLPLVSSIQTDEFEVEAFSVCRPVFHNDRFVGGLRAVISLEQITRLVSSIPVGEEGYAWLIDEQGILISHPYPEYRGRPARDLLTDHPDVLEKGLDSILEKMVHYEMGTGEYIFLQWEDKSFRQIKKLTAFAPLEVGDKTWSLAVCINYDEISGPVKAHLRNSLILLGLFGAVITVAMLDISRIESKRSKLESALKINHINEELQMTSSDRLKIQTMLSRYQTVLEHVLTRTSKCVYWKNEEGVLEGCNQHFADFASLKKPEQIVGKTLDELNLTEEQVRTLTRCDQEILRTRIPLLDIQQTFATSDSQSRSIRMDKFPLQKDGDMIGGMLVFFSFCEDCSPKEQKPEKTEINPSTQSIWSDTRNTSDGTAKTDAANTNAQTDRPVQSSDLQDTKDTSASEGNILVADDTQENCMLLEVILKKEGFRVTSCANGKEAVDLAAENRYDLILTDLQMPVMNGIEATTAIRSEGKNQETAIVAMTATTSKEDQLRCFEAGCDDYIVKPVERTVLLRKVKRFVMQSRQLAAAKSSDEITSFLEGNSDYTKTIEMFVNNLPGRVQELREALEQGNLEELSFKVHSLKGLGSFAGFPIYTEKAKELEKKIAEKNLNEIRNQIEELAQLCLRTHINHS